MPFDLNGALQAGYSEDDIAQSLAQRTGFDLAGAIKAGYTTKDILPSLMQRLQQSDARTKALQDAYNAPGKVNLGFGDIEVPSAVAKFGRSAERGALDTGQGIKQLYLMGKDKVLGSNDEPAYTHQVTQERKDYELGRGPNAGIDWGRIAGNMASTAPAMLIPGVGEGLGAQMAAGALTGGALAGTQFTDEGQSKANQVLTGAALGGAAPAVTNLAGKGLNAVRNVMRAAPDEAAVAAELGKHGIDIHAMAPEVRESILEDAAKAMASNVPLDPAALSRKANFEALGIKPTTGMVTRDPAQWTVERNMQKAAAAAGEDSPITSLYQGADQALKARLGELSQGTGGKLATTYEAGEQALGAIGNRLNKSGIYGEAAKAEDAAWEAARAAGGNDHVLDFGGFRNRIASTLDDFEDAIPGAINKRLQQFGEGQRPFTVDEAIKFRQLINNRMNPADPQNMKALRAVKQGLDGALNDLPAGTAPAVDAYQQAIAQSAAKNQVFDGLKKVINGQVDPDRFVNSYVLKADVGDLQQLKDVLSKSPEGQQAWDTLRRSVLDHITNKATAGDPMAKALSGAAMDKAVRDITPERMGVLFKPEELQKLNSIRQGAIDATYQPPFSAVNNSNSGTTIMGNLMKYGKMLPGLGEPLERIEKAMGIVEYAGERMNAKRELAEALEGSSVSSGAVKSAREQALKAFADRLNKPASLAAQQLNRR